MGRLPVAWLLKPSDLTLPGGQANPLRGTLNRDMPIFDGPARAGEKGNAVRPGWSHFWGKSAAAPATVSGEPSIHLAVLLREAATPLIRFGIGKVGSAVSGSQP
jgi:hypothetical protein